MQNTWKRLFALVLALTLCLSLLPAAYAEGDEEEQGQIQLVLEEETDEEIGEDPEPEEEAGILQPEEEEQDAGPGEIASPMTNASGTFRKMNWVLEDGTLTISGTGDMLGVTFPWTEYKTEVTKLVIEAPIHSVGLSAFKDFTSLASVSLPEGLISIEGAAFQGCTSLTEIRIPASVSSIGAGAFSNCRSLKDLPIDADNPYYKTQDGVVFSKDGSFLLVYLQSKPDAAYTVPAGVKEIGQGAFANCNNLQSLTLPGSLETVGCTFVTASAVSELFFLGSAPSFQSNSFLSKMATAWYPADDPTWTENVLLDYGGTITWKAADTTPPTITTQPKNVAVMAGEQATFKVKASGDGLSYQWYYRTSKTGSWTAVSAASGKTASYSLVAAERHDGYQYRCVVSNEAGNTSSSIVTLTILTAPSITSQPKSITVEVGTTARFTVAANGGNLDYQWYYRTSKTGSWTAVSAASGKTASYSLTAAARHNGYQYRCLVSNDAGYVYSGIVTLTVKEQVIAPSIATQPKSTTVEAGKTAKFTVVASGDDLSYQWYFRTDSSGSWKAVSAASGKTASYSLTAAERHNGYQYRCKVSNSAGAVYTGIVTLTVKEQVIAPSIATQPKSITVEVGKTAKFTVVASGDDLNYQWYFRTSSESSWSAVSAASGKTASYSLTAAARHNGYQYRCKVTNSVGTATSSIATLTVSGTAPTISTQPKDVSVDEGEKASFSVKAAGVGLSYQWYYRTSSEGSWKAVSASSGKTATYSLTTEARHDGFQYRCKVTNSIGSVTSSIATLTVVVDPLSPARVYAAMIALKSEYPEGMRWTNDNYYGWHGGVFSGGYGCAGFAFLLSDAAFGSLPARMIYDVKFEDIRVGDILRVNNDSHSVIVLQKFEDYVVLAEGNYNSSIHWGRTYTRSQVEAATYYMTRYPN